MTSAEVQTPAGEAGYWLDRRWLADACRKAGPPLLFGFRLWASISLALYVAFWLELDNAFWAGTSAAVVCQPRLGASLRKGWYRLIGTAVGVVAIVLMTACFPQNRVLFLVALALWGGTCACVATLLRNFAAYSAALAGYTVAIVASDELGTVGGLNGDAFMLAVTRASEICIGIISAGIVLAGTDLGGARRRLAGLFAALSEEITNCFAVTLTSAGARFEEMQAVRRDLVGRVIALEPVIDEGIGESSQLRYRSPVLQDAGDGLFAALAGWRAVAVHLAQMPEDRATEQAGLVLKSIPRALLSDPADEEQNRWMENPLALRRACGTAIRNLVVLPAETPSLRLLAIHTAEILVGIVRALEGLALLVGDPTRPTRLGRGVRLRVADWLPSAVNGVRAFLTIGAVALFWIVTGWPNGAGAIVWASIAVILFAPRAELAYAVAFNFTIGNMIAAMFAAVVAFAILPQLDGFAAFSAAIGLYLVPAGALMAQPWRAGMFTAMATNFIPLLSPLNQMTYNTVQFYNTAVGLVVGTGVAALSFRLLPPLSSGLRAHRLLALTLRDLRRIARGDIAMTREDWRSRAYGRLTALPEEASPLQRAQLLTALSVGSAVIQLRRIGRRLGWDTGLEGAFDAIAVGDSRGAIARLGEADRLVVERWGAKPAALRARGLILSMSEALRQHQKYFGAASG